MTLQQALSTALAQGLARIDAQMLLLHVLGRASHDRAWLIAHDGEWTRRSVASVEWARKFAAKQKLPAYDAGVVGYPQRMRDYNARRRSAG